MKKVKVECRLSHNKLYELFTLVCISCTGLEILFDLDPPTPCNRSTLLSVVVYEDCGYKFIEKTWNSDTFQNLVPFSNIVNKKIAKII